MPGWVTDKTAKTIFVSFGSSSLTRSGKIYFFALYASQTNGVSDTTALGTNGV